MSNIKRELLRKQVPNNQAQVLARRIEILLETAKQHGFVDTTFASAFFVPGRLEILGKHTDYAGGSSLVCAIQQGFTFVAFPSNAASLTVFDADTQKTWVFNLRHLAPPPLEAWHLYPLTVLKRLTLNFGPLQGGLIIFSSDLPPAAGMSSSSAMITGFLLAVAALNQLQQHALWKAHIKSVEDLATYASVIENGQSFGGLMGEAGVGTQGGSQDHTAIICSKAGRLSQFGYAPTRLLDSVPMPEAYTFAIGHSGVLAEKTGAAMAKYNRVSARAKTLIEIWNHSQGTQLRHLADLCAIPNLDLYDVWKAILQRPHDAFTDVELQDRLDQFMEEMRLVKEAVRVLRLGNLTVFGRCAQQSQHMAARLLHNQVEETNTLVAKAKRYGAVAASAFGAGFGGAVWAMVAKSEVKAFLERWQRRYVDTFPIHRDHCQFFEAQPGTPAIQIQL